MTNMIRLFRIILLAIGSNKLKIIENIVLLSNKQKTNLNKVSCIEIDSRCIYSHSQISDSSLYLIKIRKFFKIIVNYDRRKNIVLSPRNYLSFGRLY